MLWCVLLVLAVLLGCSGRKADQPGQLTIGLIAVMSGELFRYGQDAVEAARYAVKQANDAGGVPLGQGENAPRAKVRLLIEDSRMSPGATAKAAAKLIDKDGAAAIVGPAFSFLAEDVAREAESSGVPMVTPFATLTSLTRDHKDLFRIPDNNEVQARALARCARKNLGVASSAVLYDASDVYSVELDRVFTKAFTGMGGRITANTPYPENDRSFRAPLRDILAAKPDAVFLPNSYKEVMIQVRELRRMGFSGLVLGPDSWKGREIAGLKEFENTVYIDHWFPGMPTPDNPAFVRGFEKEYNHPPTEMAALTYDAFGVVFAAVRYAKSLDPRKIATALVDMPPYQGVTGLLDFTPQGDPVSEIFLVRLEKGREVLMTRIGPEELRDAQNP